MLHVFGFWMPGWQELLIIAFIALLLFGARVPKIMKDLGSGVSSFRKGLQESTSDDASSEMS